MRKKYQDCHFYSSKNCSILHRCFSIMSLKYLLFQGWLYASELYHFVQFISKARTRNVEVLYCPESAVLYQTESWRTLREQLQHSKVMGKVVKEIQIEVHHVETCILQCQKQRRRSAVLPHRLNRTFRCLDSIITNFKPLAFSFDSSACWSKHLKTGYLMMKLSMKILS